MKRVKKMLPLLTAAVLLVVSHSALSRHAALLIDADSGNVLYELEANQAWYPASLTKLMTLYMAFSALESGRLRLSDQMNVSSHAARQPTSKLGLRAWETISVEDAILAVVTRSSNDAAVVLAEKISGSESQFAIKMTAMAHGMGMYGSHFMNATGLPHDWQTTTAHDMALLAMRIIRDFPQYYPYFGVDSLYHNGRYLRSTNKFVAHYPGAEGMKTGYTCGAGYNLVATASQYGKRLIGVVLGGHTSAERYQHMFTMMDIGFDDEYGNYRSKNINTMSKSAIGTPPYQLGCGHRPSSHYAAARHYEEVEDDDHHVRYVRKAPRSSRQHAVKSKPAHPVTPREITKVRITGKTKTIVRQAPEPRQLAKTSKPSRYETSKTVKTAKSSKIAAASAKESKKTSKKTLEVTTKSKTTAKSGKALQTAKANGSSKGYYVPGKTEKKAVATKVKPATGKGYHKPESTTKAVSKIPVKATVKTKKMVKKKS